MRQLVLVYQLAVRSGGSEAGVGAPGIAVLLRLRPAGARLLEVGRCEQPTLDYAGGELFLSGLQFGQVRDDGEEVDRLGGPLRLPCFGVDQFSG